MRDNDHEMRKHLADRLRQLHGPDAAEAWLATFLHDLAGVIEAEMTRPVGSADPFEAGYLTGIRAVIEVLRMTAAAEESRRDG